MGWYSSDGCSNCYHHRQEADRMRHELRDAEERIRRLEREKDEMEWDHEREVDRLREDHRAELRREREGYESEEESMNASLYDAQEEIDALKKQLSDLRERYVSVVPFGVLMRERLEALYEARRQIVGQPTQLARYDSEIKVVETAFATWNDVLKRSGISSIWEHARLMAAVAIGRLEPPDANGGKAKEEYYHHPLAQALCDNMGVKWATETDLIEFWRSHDPLVPVAPSSTASDEDEVPF